MIFVIVPEYPEITSWKSMFNLMKKRIFEIYKNKFNVYKIYIDKDLNVFKKIDFSMNNDFDLRVKAEFHKEFLNCEELDSLLESFLLDLDKENSICLIDKSFYLTVSRFMEPTIHIEFFNVVKDRTQFQIINTSIVPLKEFGTYKKEEKNHEIHSVYTNKS